jgi:hypothetical protein
LGQKGKKPKKTYQHIQTEEEDEGGQGGNPSLQVGRGRVLSEARKIDPFMPASVSLHSGNAYRTACCCLLQLFLIPNKTATRNGGFTDLVLSESDCPIFVRSCELTNREEQET